MLRSLTQGGLALLLGASAAVFAWLLADARGLQPSLLAAGLLAALFIAVAFLAERWLAAAPTLGGAWRRAWLGLGVVVVASALVVVADTVDDVAAPRYEGGPWCEECALAAVQRIVDGDTLRIDGGERVRLYGVDAPEIGDRCADEATETLRELSGSQVRLESGPRPQDVHGRRLAYLYGEGGQSIDAALVWGGYALAWTRDGQHRDFLLALERDAQASGRGCLWSTG